MLNNTLNNKKTALSLMSLLSATVFCCVATSTAAVESIAEIVCKGPLALRIPYCQGREPKETLKESRESKETLKESKETLHGLYIDKETVTVTVTSTGCTKKEDFTIMLRKSRPPIITFIRLKPDLCRAAPHKINIQFPLKEVGATEFALANLFKPGPEF